MKHIYTKKAEQDGAGKAGATVPDGADLVYLLAHGYAKEVGASDPIEGGAIAHDATVAAPPMHGAVTKAKK